MIQVVGVGPGDVGMLTGAAREAIASSTVLVGGSRNLAMFPEYQGEKFPIKGGLTAALDYIRANSDRGVAVVASGDPLLFGIGKYLAEKLGSSRVNIIPGISSVQYLCARAHLDMNHMFLSSTHGRDPDWDSIFTHRKVGLVTDDRWGPRELAEEAVGRGLSPEFIVGVRLSYPDERVIRGSAQAILREDITGMSVVVMIGDDK